MASGDNHVRLVGILVNAGAGVSSPWPLYKAAEFSNRDAIVGCSKDQRRDVNSFEETSFITK